MVLFWIVFASVMFLVFYAYSEWKKRGSLHQRDDGAYVWTEWHGGERTSQHDPSAPDGEWSSGFGGDAGGDGGGGD